MFFRYGSAFADSDRPHVRSWQSGVNFGHTATATTAAAWPAICIVNGSQPIHTSSSATNCKKADASGKRKDWLECKCFTCIGKCMDIGNLQTVRYSSHNISAYTTRRIRNIITYYYHSISTRSGWDIFPPEIVKIGTSAKRYTTAAARTGILKRRRRFGDNNIRYRTVFADIPFTISAVSGIRAAHTAIMPTIPSWFLVVQPRVTAATTAGTINDVYASNITCKSFATVFTLSWRSCTTSATAICRSPRRTTIAARKRGAIGNNTHNR